MKAKQKTKFMAAVLISMIFIVGAVYAAEVSVSKSFPSRIDPNGVLTATFTISPAESISGFDLAELIPKGWTISSWDVSGYDKAHVTQETKTQTYGGKEYTAYHWKFGNEFSSAVTFTYTLNVPVSSGDYSFVSIWTYPGGFSSDSKTLSVAEAPAYVCGDGSCNGDENYNTCPQDCPKPVVCGDGTCEGSETYSSCPSDCPAPSVVCGDGVCDAGETYATCPSDCAAPTEGDYNDLLVGIVVVIIILIIGWLYYHYRKTPKRRKTHYF